MKMLTVSALVVSLAAIGLEIQGRLNNSSVNDWAASMDEVREEIRLMDGGRDVAMEALEQLLTTRIVDSADMLTKGWVADDERLRRDMENIVSEISGLPWPMMPQTSITDIDLRLQDVEAQ